MTARDWERYRAAREYLAERPHAGDDEIAEAAGLYLSRPGDRGVLAAAKEDARGDREDARGDRGAAS